MVELSPALLAASLALLLGALSARGGAGAGSALRGETAPPSASHERSLPPLWACALLLSFGSILVTQAGVFVENHAVQVPLIRWLNDPTLYPGDPFAASLAR